MQSPYLTAEQQVFWKDQIERHYDLAVCSVELAQQAANITLKVGSDAGVFYLRLYREKERSRHEIDAEIRALLGYRPARNIHVSKPVELRGGGFVFSCHYHQCQRWAALFTLAPGVLPPANALGLRQLGEALGILHIQMSHVFPVGRHFDAEAIVSRATQSASAPGPGFRPAETRLKEEGAALIAELDACGQLQPGFCHGDVWLGKNVHFLGECVTFFDFDDCVDGPLAIDLATPIAGLWYAGLPDFAAQASIFLDAYNCVRSPGMNDILAIAALVRLYEIRLLGVLGGWRKLTPHEWEMAVDHFEQRMEEWRPGGAASSAISEYARNRSRQGLKRPIRE